VVEVDGPALKIVARGGWSVKLLEVGEVIELQVVIEERGFEADAFFQLQKRGLVGEAGSARFGVEGFDGWEGLAVAGAEADETSVGWPMREMLSLRMDLNS